MNCLIATLLAAIDDIKYENNSESICLLTEVSEFWPCSRNFSGNFSRRNVAAKLWTNYEAK